MDWPAVAISVASFLVLNKIQPRPGSISNARLAQLEKRMNILEAHLGIAQDESNNDIVKLLWEGKKIDAIKLYRQRNGIGLADAKKAVEQMERDLKQTV